MSSKKRQNKLQLNPNFLGVSSGSQINPQKSKK